MSKKKDDDKSKKDRDKDTDNDNGKYEEPRPQRDFETDPVEVHRDYVRRQLEGGAPATPEAYARALEQWHKLPGAVRVPATELTGDEPDSTSEQQKDTSHEGPRS